jgi:hypothetical protein
MEEERKGGTDREREGKKKEGRNVIGKGSKMGTRVQKQTT